MRLESSSHCRLTYHRTTTLLSHTPQYTDWLTSGSAVRVYRLSRFTAEQVAEDLEARGGPGASTLFALPVPPHQVLAWLQSGEVGVTRASATLACGLWLDCSYWPAALLCPGG